MSSAAHPRAVFFALPHAARHSLYQIQKQGVTEMTMLATVLSVQPNSLLVWDQTSR